MTENAAKFISPLTFETLTGNKCYTDTFDRDFEFDVEHIALAKKADVFMIAPATANIIAKTANGIADDMLTTTFLAASKTKIIVPAMNTNMHVHRIVGGAGRPAERDDGDLRIVQAIAFRRHDVRHVIR